MWEMPSGWGCINLTGDVVVSTGGNAVRRGGVGSDVLGGRRNRRENIVIRDPFDVEMREMSAGMLMRSSFAPRACERRQRSFANMKPVLLSQPPKKTVDHIERATLRGPFNMLCQPKHFEHRWGVMPSGKNYWR